VAVSSELKASSEISSRLAVKVGRANGKIRQEDLLRKSYAEISQTANKAGDVLKRR
jgi:hypothetical protein